MRINLSPCRNALKQDDNFNLKAGLMVVVVFLFLLIWHFSLVKKINNNFTKINDLNKKAIESSDVKRLEIKTKENQVLQKFSELRNRRINFIKKLNLVYQGVVGSVCLDQISIDKQGGVVVMGNSKSVANLRNFVANLVSGGVENNLVIKKVKKNDRGYQFILTW